MNQIDNLTDAADQISQVILEDGTIMQLELFYQAAVQRWTANITHPTLTVQGITICINPNMLRQWRNVIDFGIACTTTTGADPFDIEDFANDTAQLYALNAADVAAIESQVFGGALQ